MLGHPAFALPSIEEVIELTVALGRLTNPAIRCVGVSLNTAELDDDEARACSTAKASASVFPWPTRFAAAPLSIGSSMPASSEHVSEPAPPSTWFQRFLLPGLAFKAVVIGGGYATGRELAEFFMPSGPWGGMAAIASSRPCCSASSAR